VTVRLGKHHLEQDQAEGSILKSLFMGVRYTHERRWQDALVVRRFPSGRSQEASSNVGSREMITALPDTGKKLRPS